MKATLKTKPSFWVPAYLWILEDPIIQTKLSPETFKFLLNCVLLSGRYCDGVLPSPRDIGWILRDADAVSHVTVLASHGIVTEIDECVIINALGAQSESASDTAEDEGKSLSPGALRTRRYRERRALAEGVTNPSPEGVTGKRHSDASLARVYSPVLSSAVSEGGTGETVTNFTPPRSAAVTTMQRPDQHRKVESEHSPISMGEFRTAWDRHHRRHNRESMDMAYKQIVSMGETFDPERFRANHPAYCDHWDKIGWDNDFGKALTFIAWLQNGMPEPPPIATKPAGKAGKPNLMEMLAEIGEES